MTSLLTRRQWRRVAVAVAVGLTAYVAAVLLQLEPDLVLVLLLAALVLGGFSLLSESVDPVRTAWYPPTAGDPLTRGRDGATFADLRLLESHQSARDPDHHLRRRLAELADRALRPALGMGLDSDEGRARLGPEVVGLLTGPSKRLSPRDIDLCLRTIEEL